MAAGEHSMNTPRSLDTEQAEAFIAATSTAFEELCKTSIELRQPSPAGEQGIGHIVATMVLHRDPPGQLTLSFPQPTLELLAQRYLEGSASLTRELLEDAAGEFLNVIAGQAKTMLKGTEAHYHLSIPTVSGVEGFSAMAKPDALSLDFETDCGQFSLIVSLPSRCPA